MPRIGEVIPKPHVGLTPYLANGVVDAVAEVCESLNKFDPDPFGIIPNFLNDEGLSLLGHLDVPLNGKCPMEDLMSHSIGGPLAHTMARISLANMDLRHESKFTKISLKNEMGLNVHLDAHRDLLDGHAVIYSYGVSGELHYVLDGVRYPINNNTLVILNGAAQWCDITEFLPGHEHDDLDKSWRYLGGVTMVHAVESSGFTSRNRLLVYADGQETTTTQIPAQLPPWF